MRWIPSLLAILAVVAAPAFGAGSRLAVARASVEKGDKLMQKERYEAAEKAFRKAIDNEPTLPTAYHGLGRALVAQQRFAEAIEPLEEAKDRYVRWAQDEKSTEMEARQEAAARARAFQDLKNTQKIRQSGAGTSPAADLTRMASTRIETEKYLAGKNWKYEDLEAVPADVFYLDGLARLRTGDKDAGIRELDTCLVLEPDHGLAHYNLAVALFTSGQVRPAKEHLDAAVAAGVDANPRFVADVDAAYKALPPTP